jgi:uncharacterized protein (TIGR02246 family)
MQTRLRFAAAATLWFSIPWSSNAEDVMDRKSIDEANAKLEALQKEGDAAGMGAMYTEDAILLPAGGRKTEGRDAIEAFWADKLGSAGADVQLTTEDLVPVGGDLAYEIGSYTATPKDATPVSGQYLVLWKRVDGSWKLHVDIFNEGLSR